MDRLLTVKELDEIHDRAGGLEDEHYREESITIAYKSCQAQDTKTLKAVGEWLAQAAANDADTFDFQITKAIDAFLGGEFPE